MQTVLSKVSAAPMVVRCPAVKTVSSAKPVICRAAPGSDVSTSSKFPEWVPEAAVPALKFLGSSDFNLEGSEFYKNKVQAYAENPWVQKSLGWKAIPETINSRAAMTGFVAAAGAELLGAGPILSQLSAAPLSVVITIALLTAATIIPLQKGTEGEYLASLRDSYSLPEGWFTEERERAHGRLAMLGLTGMIFFEVLIGHVVL